MCTPISLDMIRKMIEIIDYFVCALCVMLKKKTPRPLRSLREMKKQTRLSLHSLSETQKENSAYLCASA